MPDLNKFNLDSLFNRKLDDIHISDDAQKMAQWQVDSIGKNPEKIAELAFLTRTEIFAIVQAQVKKDSPLSAETVPQAYSRQLDFSFIHNAKLKQIHPSQKAFDTLLRQKSFQAKVAYYKKLLEASGAVLQTGLKKHANEINQLNGDYLKYKELWKRQMTLEQQLDAVMAELFAERGHDPDSMLVGARELLEKELVKVTKALEEKRRENSDTAAFLQYEKIKRYSEELQDGFAWTESRKRIVKEALSRAMASRPLIVLMGESGTGKTALARALSRKLTGMEPEREVGGKDYRLRDLIGSRAIDDQGDYLKFGPLLRAMTGMDSSRDKSVKNQGGIYFDDEFNTRPVEVQRQILKFVAEAKPGQTVTVPGTEIKVTIQPKFLYLAAGNPNNDRYDREETPVEAYREFSGVLDVDYLSNTKDEPELMEIMVASLMDQKTRRLRVVSREEVMPAFMKDSHGKQVLDELPGTGGFLWRFSLAWKGILQAFVHQENPLHVLNSTEPKEKYFLQKFILDPGKVRDWLHQYKVSGGDHQHGIELFLKNKLIEEMRSFPIEDQQVVTAMLRVYGIDLTAAPTPKKSFTSMTPKDIGYLFPNVARPGAKDKPLTPAPEAPPVDLDDDGDEMARPTPPPLPADAGFLNHPDVVKNHPTVGQSVTGKIAALVGFSLSEKVKLHQLAATYKRSVEIGKFMDRSLVQKSLDEVFDQVLRLGLPMLKEILQFGKPTLLVTPKNTFDEKIQAMNSRRVYPNEDPVFVWQDNSSPYRQIGTPAKVRISIVDGAEHMPHIPGIASNLRFDQRKEAFKQYYRRKGMRLINLHEYAVFMEGSRFAYHHDPNKDPQKIIDFYKDSNDTVTCFDDEYLSSASGVAYGFFDSESRRVYFGANDPGGTVAYLRGRPSVRVMEY